MPSHLYSFSFEPKPTWSKLFSSQPEILDYLKGVTDKYGLRRYIRFNSRAARAHWDDTEYPLACVHRLRAGVRRAVPHLGSRRAAHSTPARHRRTRRFRTAPLSIPRSGTTMSTSPDKRVAVIGTGASAIQIVPGIIGQVAELQLYQRTPPWVVPRPNKPFPRWLKTAFTNVPGLRLAVRTGIYWFLEGLGYAMTKRPALLRAVEAVGKVEHPPPRRRQGPAPSADADTIAPGCKRILYSPNYYQAVANPKAKLITDRHRADHPDRHRHGRRHRTPRRRHRLGHRVPCHRLLHLLRHQGSAR